MIYTGTAVVVAVVVVVVVVTDGLQLLLVYVCHVKEYNIIALCLFVYCY